jgi:acetyl esterase/lipase
MGSRNIRNISRPMLIPVLPDPAKANGTAVIVAPGGGFTALMIDNEGYAVARWLAERGIVAFVLKYRLNQTPADPAVYRQSLIKQLTGVANERIKSSLATPAFALQDAQDAVRIVRQRASDWGVNPQRIGFIGFSAGALTTMSVGLTADKDARPDFIGPIYGSMERQVVPADAPPMFAALAADDALFGKSDLGLIAAWREAKRPYELHIYERGGHGFGMRQQGATSDLWIEQFHAWLKARKLVPAAK